MRSHGDQPPYIQRNALKARNTKPRRSTSVASIVYGRFDPVFSQVATDGVMLYIAELGLTGWDGGAEPHFEERWLIVMSTDVVELRKLIGGVKRHFPHPFCHFGAKSVLQTSGLSERVSVFGRFMAHQILPNFTSFYQKCAAKGGRRGSKRQLMRGFLRAIYLNRVKSGGSCQALIGAPPDPPERGGRKDGRG